MKSAVVLLLVLQMLTGGRLGGESYKVVWLCEHYALHHKQLPAMGWWHFLALHYANPLHHQNDHESHTRLPFLDDSWPIVTFAISEHWLLLHPSNEPTVYVSQDIDSPVEKGEDKTEHPPC